MLPDDAAPAMPIAPVICRLTGGKGGVRRGECEMWNVEVAKEEDGEEED